METQNQKSMRANWYDTKFSINMFRLHLNGMKEANCKAERGKSVYLESVKVSEE